MLVRLKQLRKAYLPMLVTPSGMVMLVSPVQPSKAELPMFVTLVGMVMLVRLLRPEKAKLPKLVTPDPITTSVMSIDHGARSE